MLGREEDNKAKGRAIDKMKAGRLEASVGRKALCRCPGRSLA